jgi:Fic family protein
MEGNTYNILETEQLVRFGQEAAGKDRKEAVMILNHKEAIQYVVDNIGAIGINRQDICNIHALLADGLLIDPAMAGRLRRLPAAITHSSYTPLEDEFQIEEEFTILIEKVAAIPDPFELSFFLLAFFPYFQAFDDINKRTSRIASNIPLLKADLAPMSFIAMDAKIPERDRQQVVDYAGAQFRGLHEGNAIRYRLRPADLVGLSSETNSTALILSHRRKC